MEWEGLTPTIGAHVCGGTQSRPVHHSPLEAISGIECDRLRDVSLGDVNFTLDMLKYKCNINVAISTEAGSQEPSECS